MTAPMDDKFEESQFDADWRRPAPRARALAMRLYGWRDPGSTFALAALGAAPFAAAAAIAPALLSLAPTAELIGPIAEAKALAVGAAPLSSAATPLYSALLLFADLFVDAPGRAHLLAKAVAAAAIALPAAYLCSARFPILAACLVAAALAAYVAAPFSGPAEIGLAIFLLAAIALICPPADDGAARARLEGCIGGLGLAALWLTSPVFSFAGFLVMSFAPFVGGRAGLVRYVGAAVIFCFALFGLELGAPGFNVARLDLARSFLGGDRLFGEGALALGGLAASTTIVIFAAAIFGGRKHWRGWALGLLLLGVSLIAARLAQANPSPVFLISAGLAVFSIASPFYDGIFRRHDRASVSLALATGLLTVFWMGAQVAHNASQLLLQHRALADAPADIRAELGLIQPGGPTFARWIEEGRFSTPEARELFALAPVDQSFMLLKAAARAREISDRGFDVAILTGADSACVIAGNRQCRADGASAAGKAKVVFVPRIDLDLASASAKGRAEALLYTEFRLTEQTALWDVWVRRGANLPADLAATLAPGLDP